VPSSPHPQTVLLEVRHTLHEPPTALHSMRKAVTVGLSSSFVFYVAVGVAGYAALGANTPGDILTGFSGPVWAVNAANIMVLVHMVSAYQVFSQPVFHAVEAFLCEKSKVLARAPPLALRIPVRSTYVVFTTAVACIMPFFSDIIGVIGERCFGWYAAGVHCSIGTCRPHVYNAVLAIDRPRYHQLHEGKLSFWLNHPLGKSSVPPCTRPCARQPLLSER